MSADNIGLLIFVAVALAYANAGGAAPKQELVHGPNVAREVDITRWKHDGTQPLYWSKGNGASFIDETASAVKPMLM